MEGKENYELAVMPRSQQELERMAEFMAKSGYFKDAQQLAEAVVKIQFGRELGYGPASAMASIHVVNGKPTLSADLMARGIKRSGRYDYAVRELTDKKCTLAFYELIVGNRRPLGESTFSLDDAKRAGLLDGPNKHSWQKYPRNMLFSRAVSNGQRWYCPDAFDSVVYTHEEMDLAVDPETGEVIDAQYSEIPTLDQTPPEPYEYSAESSPQTSKPKSKQNGRPLPPEKLIAFLQQRAEQYAQEFGDIDASTDMQKRIASCLNDLADGDQQKRYSFMLETFGIDSVKDMKRYHGLAYCDWMGVPDGGFKAVTEQCAEEFNRIVNARIQRGATGELPEMEE